MQKSSASRFAQRRFEGVLFFVMVADEPDRPYRFASFSRWSITGEGVCLRLKAAARTGESFDESSLVL